MIRYDTNLNLRERRRKLENAERKYCINMLAPCGMNCKVCYNHCYHKKSCSGCLNSDLGKPEHCPKCKMKDCVKDKGLKYCFECSNYPCQFIKNLEKSYNKRYQASLMEDRKRMFECLEGQKNKQVTVRSTENKAFAIGPAIVKVGLTAISIPSRGVNCELLELQNKRLQEALDRLRRSKAPSN